MDNENLEQEESSILTLTDENGQDVDFEYLDCIEYQGKEYLVLMPADEVSTEIVILEVEPVDEENENYLSVQDEGILNAVYDIFKEKYKGILTFEEDRRKAAPSGRLFCFRVSDAYSRTGTGFRMAMESSVTAQSIARM